MASKYLNLSGRTKWVNGKFGGLFEPDPEYNNYQLIFYPDPDSWDKIKKSGLQLQSKNDEDGDFLKFRRAKEKVIKGEKVQFGRPKVFFTGDTEPTRNIGNGSSVDVSVVVYDAGKHKGHRLESVTVTNLIEFERRENNLRELQDDNDTEQDAAEEDAPRAEGTVASQQSSEIKAKQSEGSRRETTEDLVPFDDGVPFGDEKEVKTSTNTKSVSPFKRMSR